MAALPCRLQEDDAFIPLLPSLTAAAAAEEDGSGKAADRAAGLSNSSASGRTPDFQPPWLPRLMRFGSPLLRLHNEVVAFAKMLEPTAEEVESRARSMRTVREVVHSIWPKANVMVFGSYETGLYTPASDTDIVVCDTGLNDPTKGANTALDWLRWRSTLSQHVVGTSLTRSVAQRERGREGGRGGESVVGVGCGLMKGTDGLFRCLQACCLTAAGLRLHRYYS